MPSKYWLYPQKLGYEVPHVYTVGSPMTPFSSWVLTLLSFHLFTACITLRTAIYQNQRHRWLNWKKSRQLFCSRVVASMHVLATDCIQQNVYFPTVESFLFAKNRIILIHITKVRSNIPATLLQYCWNIAMLLVCMEFV